MRCRDVLLVVALVLVLSGCPVPIPPLGYSSQSRDNLPERVPEFIVNGRTTREEVLLRIGVPDSQAPDGRWFAYHSERHTGGVVFVVAAGSSAAGAGVFGYEERLLIVRFDARSIVTEVTLESRVCPRGAAAFGSSGGESAPCLKIPRPAEGQPPELLALKSFYVTQAEADARAINRLIADALRRKGLVATTGPANETPKEIDAIVTYAGVWTPDATGRMDQLTARILAPGSATVLATATSHQSAAGDKTPEEMVVEAVAEIFAGPGKPFLTLPPYRSTLNGRLATPTAGKAPVRIEPVRDARIEGRGQYIGERSALGVSMGRIDLSPMPSDVIDQLLRAELAAMGHRSAGADAEFVIDARLVRFEVWTPSTLIYWDIEGVIAIDLAVTQRAGDQREFHYEATCTDRTYVNPSEALVKGVVLTCLAKLGAKVREDRALGELLSSQVP